MSKARVPSIIVISAILGVIGTVIVALIMAVGDTTPAGSRLVVYCAHDEVYSKAILEKFTEETGIRIDVRPDTEATKSLGLVNAILNEKNNPRCDVFWNNELLGTLDLLDAGLLEPYKGSGWERIPDSYKDAEGHWTGFAARLRVEAVNLDDMDATREAVQKAMSENDLSKMAIAKPLYGTTRTHFTVLWHQRGGDLVQEFHKSLRERKVNILPGNGPVMEQIANGDMNFGWTDTDDFFVAKDIFVAKDKENSVGMVPYQLDPGGQTICIPNTVCIIKGTKNPEDAQRLVDYLLSANTELALARSASRQIPLGPVDEAQLPEPVRELIEPAANGYDLTDLGKARQECLEWLKKEYP